MTRRVIFLIISLLRCILSHPEPRHIFRLKTCTAAISICCSSIALLANAAEYKTEKFSISYPNDFVVSPKLVRTHEEEVFLKSSLISGFNAGVTIDKVKLDSIKDFASPDELAARVVAVEKGREGVFEVEVLKAYELPLPLKRVSVNEEAYPIYEIEYHVDSSRGKNHYDVRALIARKQLYVFTVQYKETDDVAAATTLQKTASDMLESFTLQ